MPKTAHKGTLRTLVRTAGMSRRKKTGSLIAGGHGDDVVHKEYSA